MEDLIIGKSESGDLALLKKIFIALVVIFSLIFGKMDSSIDFQCNTLFGTIEIKNRTLTQKLAAKSNSECVITNMFPEELFGFCWILSHFSCEEELIPRSTSTFSRRPPFLLGRKGMGDGGSSRREGTGEREKVQRHHRIQHVPDPAVLFRTESRKIELGVLRQKDVCEFMKPLFQGRGDCHGRQCSKR